MGEIPDMGQPMRAETSQEDHITDVQEAVSTLIENFDSMEARRKELNATPYSDKALVDDDQAMAEDDTAAIVLEPYVDSFREDWRRVDPAIKAATLQALSEKGREDIVKEIQKFDRPNGF